MPTPLPSSFIDRVYELVGAGGTFSLTPAQGYLKDAILEVIWRLKFEGYITTKEV